MAADRKLAVVTGGTRGIGQACVERLSGPGQTVIFVGRSKDDGTRLAEKVQDALFLPCDLTRTEDQERLVRLVDEVGGGRLDGLVNNAGATCRAPFVDTTPADLDTIVAVNTRVPFSITQRLLPFLVEAGGAVVNIASIAGTGGEAGLAAYSASKGALIALTKTLALELGERVRFNSVSPGQIETEMTRALVEDPELTKVVRARIPAARLGAPRDIAGVVSFLLSADAGFVNGINLVVDGGETAGVKAIEWPKGRLGDPDQACTERRSTPHRSAWQWASPRSRQQNPGEERSEVTEVDGGAQALKVPKYEVVEVGETLGPVDLVVDDHRVKQFAYATGDFQCRAALGLSTPGPGAPVAQAGLLAAPLLRLWNTRYRPDVDFGIHQKEEIWFESPLRVGEAVRLEGHTADKYIRRGKEYVVTEGIARSATDGRTIVRHRATEIVEMNSSIKLGSGEASGEMGLGARSSRRVQAVYPAGAPKLTRASRMAKPGSPVSAEARQVHQSQIAVFSNVEEFWRTIHTDLETARRAGFEAPLAQALMGTMRISELGTELFGGAWSRSGWISVSYLKPIYAGDSLEVFGVLIDKSELDATVNLEFEVWISNQRGEHVSVGWMGATIDE